MKKLNAKNTTIRFLQHIVAGVIAFVLCYVLTGTNVMLQGINGYYSYNLYESDKSRNYEESYLFNNILGNNVSDVLRLVAVKTQLETNGTYDDRKEIYNLYHFLNHLNIFGPKYLMPIKKTILRYA